MTFSLHEVRRRLDGRAGRVAALDGVSLEVAPGERLVVLGPSGAGKTTLFGVLNTTLLPTEGTVRFEGRDVSRLTRRGLRAVRRRIGTVFQQPRLVPSLTARQNALLGRVGHWSFAEAMRAWVRPSPEDLARVDAALEAVGLVHRAGRAGRRAVGRRAAAGGHRPGPGPGAHGGARGRAVLVTRPRAAREHGRAPPRRGGARPHPGRGDARRGLRPPSLPAGGGARRRPAAVRSARGAGHPGDARSSSIRARHRRDRARDRERGRADALACAR